MMKKFFLALTFFSVFLAAVAIWYLPVLFKGYNSTTVGSHALVRARNYAETGIYATENEQNVILAPELILSDSQESFYGNRLGTILYSYLLKFFPLHNNNQIVLANSMILALSLVISALAVYILFNLKIAVLFSAFYIFFPSTWFLPQYMVGYEFSFVFLALFFLFFVLANKKGGAGPLKNRDRAYLILSGISLALVGLSREALFLIYPILLLFLVAQRQFKRLLLIFIPIAAILGILWLPDFLSGKNTYLLFFTGENESLKSADYSYYAHLFPDPYTYYYDREPYLAQYLANDSDDLMKGLGAGKVMQNMGFKSVGLGERISIAMPLFLRHLFRFFSISEMGGPLIFMLMAAGFYVLKTRNNFWFKFFSSWILGSLFLLAFVNLAGRNHLMDFGFAVGIGIALGMDFVSETFSEKIFNNNYRRLATVLFAVFIVYNLILSGHIMLSMVYNKSTVPIVEYYSNKVKEFDIAPEEVIALPLDANNAFNLNFATRKSIIVLRDETVKKLITENKLKEVFGLYNVKYILGYNPDIAEEILKNAEVALISDNSVDLNQKASFSTTKSWFLNLIK
ncbi:hypothetical protein C4572_01990 [Candidatus Parcubacteria bacterium]|nr:MAG: hypothetical protein C4572_01990 [Candidatus Parcubacteria bacterium]